MKKIYSFLLLSALCLTQVSAQLFFNEDFNYPLNSTLINNGWTQILNTNTLPISSTVASLNYQGYAGAGLGNAAMLLNSGQDVYRESSAITNTKSLYTSFLLNDSIAQLGGNYFFSLASSTTTTAVAKVFIKLSSAGFYKLGVSKGTETPVYSIDSFAVQNTYLCVLKYQFNTASTRDDSVMLYAFNSGMPSTEPSTPIVASIGGNTIDATNLSRVVLTQGDAATSPTVFIDGIRMANAWDKLNGSSLVNPYPVNTIVATASGVSSINISWNRPYNFDSTSMKTLVFVKAASAITQGTPSISTNNYVANANFAFAVSHYQNDTAARCVYNGISNSLNVYGLSASSFYSILIYVVSNTDSIYSRSLTSSVTTLSLPTAATLPNFTSSSYTSAKIAWTRPAAYNRNTMTTLVFLKSSSSINLQTPSTGSNAFTADSNFASQLSSSLASDASAKCVYKGDTNFVNISSLQAGMSYYYVIYVVRDTDSSYSLPTQSSASLQTAVIAASSPTFVALSTSAVKITWNKPQTYVGANMTTLVFIKTLNSVNQNAIPRQSASTIHADSVYTLGDKFQLDTAAFCVYKGDTNFVSVSGLATGTLYYAVIYLMRDSDNLYSIPTNVSGLSKQGPPVGISTLKFTGLGQTSARVNWVKPGSYSNTLYSTLVFLKQNTAINIGSASRTVTYYTASANFLSAVSTKYQNDSMAKCIYKGDTNFVNITGLLSNTSYHVLIYVVRDGDSSYSVEGTTSGNSLGIPAFKYIGQVNTSNPITGDADSLGVRATLRGIVFGFNQRRNNQGGIQFLLKDATGGINVLHTTKTFSYMVTEGDSVEVQGTIGSSSGLVSIANLDTVIRLDVNKSTDNPVVFNTLSEQSENNLIRIDNLKFLHPPTYTTWPKVGNTPTTMAFLKSNDIDTVIVRLASANTLSGSPVPSTRYFSIIGIGSQTSTSSSAPYLFNGYQILPRTATDIIEIPDSLSAFSLDSLPNNDTLVLNGNPTNTFKLSWNAASSVAPASNTKYSVAFTKGNTSNIVYTCASTNNGQDTFAWVNQKTLADATGATIGDTVALKWMVMAQTGNFIQMSDTFNLYVAIGSFFTTAINEVKQTQSISIYPNPAKENIWIESTQKIDEISLMDTRGRELISMKALHKNQVWLDTKGLSPGIYVVKIADAKSEKYTKIVIE